MLMVACFALAVLAVPLTGGRLSRLDGFRLHRISLLLAALAVQIVVISVVPGEIPAWAAASAHLATYGLAVAFLMSNRGVKGLWVVGIGAALNLAAIAANGGVMPAPAGALEAAGRAVIAGEFENSAVVAHPRLALLGDVFAVPESWPLANVFSVGDVLIVLGAAGVVHSACGSRLAPRSRSAAQASSEMERDAPRSASIAAPASMSSSAVSPRGSPSPRKIPAVGPSPPSALAASTTAAEFQVGCSDV